MAFPRRRAARSVAFDCLILTVGALLLNGCLLRAKRGEPPLTGSVNFEGNKAIGADELRNKIALTKSGRKFIIQVGEAYTFEPGGLRLDKERIQRLYRAHGYYDAKVTEIRTQEDNGRMNVTFVIDEGPPTHITSLDIKGMEKLDPQLQWRLQNTLPLKIGDVFQEFPYEQAKALLETSLKNEGFMRAAVEGEVEVNPKQQTAAVHLTAQPGLQYHVGTIRIEGILGSRNSPDVSRDRVLDATHLKVGDVVTPKALTAAHDGVAAMGVFASAEVRADYSPQSPETNVLVTVKEAPFQTLEAGAGIEVDQTRQVGRGTLLYTHKNLGAGLQKLIVGGSFGYAFLPSIFRIQEQGIVADLRTQYIQPRIYRLPIDAQMRVDYTKDLLPAFVFQRVGARAGLLMYLDNPTFKGITFAPSINYEYYFNVGPSVGTSQVGARTSPLAVSGCGPDIHGNLTSTCTLAYIEGILNFDRRDNPLSPRKGFFFSFGAQYAGLPGSNFSYVRFTPEGRVYLPMTQRLTLALRVRYGILNDLDPNKRVPPGIAHFFAGGANSVRAAGTQLLGPLTFVVADNGDFPKKSSAPFVANVPIPLGGDHLLEGSVELRWDSPIENLSFALFVDAGRVWTTNPVDPGSTASPPGYQWGPGFGVRYRTPLGPIRLDLAFRRSSLDTHPVNVDISNVSPSSIAANRVPSLNPADYRVALDCPSSSPTPWTCYSLPRINFYLTIGEAF